MDRAAELVDPIRAILDDARQNLAQMNEAVPNRESTMDEKAKEAFREERERLNSLFSDLEQKFNEASKRLDEIRNNLTGARHDAK